MREGRGQGRWRARLSSPLWLLLLLVLAPVLLLGGCASLSSPKRFVLSAAELQDLLSRRFPQEQRLLDVFEVRASAPELRLLPESRRLAVKLDLLARERWLGNRVSGRIDFNAGLRWNAADYTVRLEQVRVQDLVVNDGPLQLPGAPGELPPPRSQRTFERTTDRSTSTSTSTSASTSTSTSDSLSTLGSSLRRTALERVGAALAERLLEDMVLYRLSDERVARMQAAGLQPASLTITSSGLEVTFASAAP